MNRQTRCGWRCCRIIRAKHINDACPRGEKTWKEPRSIAGWRYAVRIPLSVNDREVIALHEVLRCVQRGGDPRLIAKLHSSELGNVLGIVSRGRKRAERKSKSATPALASAAVQLPAPPLAASAQGAASGVGVADPAREAAQ